MAGLGAILAPYDQEGTVMTDHTEAEAIRAERQAEIAPKIARLRERAARLEKQAESLMAEFNHYRQDIAFLTQPSNPNRPFTKRRNQIVARYDKGQELLREVKRLRERADHLEKYGVRVKGDAERARQSRRDALDTVIGKGSRVMDFVFGAGTVVRVNRLSYTVQFDSGGKYARDKSFVRPL